MSDPTVAFTVRLSAADAATLAQIAKRQDRSVSYLVRAAVQSFLAKEAQR